MRYATAEGLVRDTSTGYPVSNFPHLLAPLELGRTTVRNRMVMGAMHTRLGTLDRPVERLAAFYGARAKGEVGLILTGGYSPTPEGVMEAGSPLLNSEEQLVEHRAVVDAVHANGGRIVLQVLHAGRYARVADCVAPSAGKARINRFSQGPVDRRRMGNCPCLCANGGTCQIGRI